MTTAFRHSIPTAKQQNSEPAQKALQRFFERRKAEHNASHLLPLLRTGMKVLDIGPGPGTITTGLANVVYPGITYGIDKDPEQVATATRKAQAERTPNTIFLQGDAQHLPFPDDFFDAVHVHALLHTTRAVAPILNEAKRVLMPSGLLAVREPDLTASYLAPANPAHQDVFRMLADVTRRSGGDPAAGRHLKTLLLNAGFTTVRISACPDFFDSTDEIDALEELPQKWALGPEIEKIAIESGRWSKSTFGELRKKVALWAQRRSATGCLHFGQATCLSPA